MKKLKVILIAILIITPVCAYPAQDSGLAINASSGSFPEWVNTSPKDNSIDENAEKMLLREQWERNIGIDLFYPYFKAKELESKVREKTSVRILKLKGKAEFENNEAKYIFSIKF